MAPMDESERTEYAALMRRVRDWERTSEMCWIASAIAAAILLGWGIGSRSSGLMLPVVLVTACGFYSVARGRQQAKLMAGYVEEFFETQRSGPQWFTRLGQLPGAAAGGYASEWLGTYLANGVILVAVVFAWIFAGDERHGELMAGIVTGCGVAFAFHSISETSRLAQVDFTALWKPMHGGPGEERRSTRVASR